ncbi:MAG: HDOD domain-containing protein [Pseudomonadota bacterium]
MSNDQILLARQPIYDVKLQVIGYELLFRPSRDLIPDEKWCPDSATSQVILNTFTEVQSSIMTEGKPVFINFTRNLILNRPNIKPKDIVIEILEDVEPDELLVNSVRQLVEQGYTFALDDFVYSEQWEPLLELAQIIKIDVLSLSREQIQAEVKRLQPYSLTLLAEKVENHDMYDFCLELGFEMFQGYFLCKPQCMRGRTMPASRLAVLKLLTELQDPDIEVKALEETITKDPSLSIKLLRLFTTSTYAHLSKIDSIQHAITLLGLQQLKSWISLIALSKLDDKPSAIILTALNRARFCENLAKAAKLRKVDQFYTSGLFSMLDAFFDCELSFILDKLPLAPDINQGLLEFKGDIGQILSVVMLYDRAEWENINWQYLEEQQIDDTTLEKSYLEALEWSGEVSKKIFA